MQIKEVGGILSIYINAKQDLISILEIMADYKEIYAQ